MIDEGNMKMPKQDVSEGQKAGYIGDVETFDKPKPGNSNATVADEETKAKAAAKPEDKAVKASANK